MSDSVTSPPANSEAERGLVLQHVRRAWRAKLGDAACEDAVSAAYQAFLERGHRAGSIENRAGWLCTAAWRAANDEYKRTARRHVTEALDPATVPSSAPPPEHRLEAADLAARLRVAYRRLPKELRLAYATKHMPGVTVDEACRRLRCPRSTLMHRRARALRELHAVVQGTSDRVDQAFMEMASAVLAGDATEAARRQLRDLVSNSPHYAARFAELRRLERGLGAVVGPATLEPLGDSGPFDQLAAVIGRVRDAAHQIFTRSADAADAPVSAVGGGAATGGLAGLGAGVGATKLALTCGAAAAICAATVGPIVSDRGDPNDPPRPERTTQERSGAQTRLAPVSAPEVSPAQVGNEPIPATVSSHEVADPVREPGQPAPNRQPSPAEGQPSADFSFGDASAKPATSPALPAAEPPETAPTPAAATSGGEGSSGGSAPAEQGDFSFGG